MSHTVYMTENTHSVFYETTFSLALFTCRFGMPSAEPAARVHLVKVAVW